MHAVEPTTLIQLSEVNIPLDWLWKLRGYDIEEPGDEPLTPPDGKDRHYTTFYKQIMRIRAEKSAK